jgi:uncharacterized protein with FMN-binding domain
VRRVLIWMLSTLTVVVLLFGYRTSRGATVASTTVIPPVASQTTGSSGSAGSASGSTTKRPSKSSRSTTGTAEETVTGSVAQTEWGPVQVQLVVADGKITKVELLEYPDGNSRDAQINSYAIPRLVSETLDAQSAKIDMVSGATVTSDGYLTSLQSALDQADLSTAGAS